MTKMTRILKRLFFAALVLIALHPTGAKGTTPLISAIDDNRINDVKELLRYGANPNEKYWSTTPLNTAIEKNLPEIVKALLQYGANPDEKGSQWNTPLYHAVDKNLLEIVKILLQYKANPEGEHPTIRPLWSAAENNRPEIVKALLQAGAKIFPTNNLLWSAVYNNRTEVAKALLQHGADQNEQGRIGKHLYNAIDKNYPEMVRVLVTAGANIHEKAYSWSDSFLHKAIDANHPEIVRILVTAGAKTRERDDRGHDPLYKAIDKNYPEVVRALLETDTTLQKDNFYSLWMAIKRNYHGVVNALLQVGANPNEKDSFGNTHLHTATSESKLPIVQALVEHKADVNAKNIWGYTPRNYAAKNKEIDSYLAAHGGQLGALNPYIKATLITAGALIATYTYYKRYDIADWWHGHDRSLPLHQAARWGRLAVVSKLLNQGTGVNLVDNAGLTAIQWATKNRRLEIIRLLIQHGAHIDEETTQLLLADIQDINATDILGNTLLYYAAQNGEKEAIRSLIQNGAKITQSIIDRAGMPKIKDFLEKKLFTLGRNDKFFQEFITKNLEIRSDLSLSDVKKNLEILLRWASSRDTKFVNRFYDTICANFTEQERKAFGFNYQNVRELYLDLAKYTKQKHWAKKKGWLETCFKLCKGPIFDTSYHGDFESSVRLFVEKEFGEYQQKELRKDYEKNFLFYQNLHKLTKPGLKIPKNIDTMPNIVVVPDNGSIQKQFVDIGITFTKKSQ